MANAATYNLSSASNRPPCTGGTWTVNGNVYTCNNGRVTLANGDNIIANATATIISNGGFTLASNTSVGTVGANISITSSSGTITSTGATTIYGAVNSASGAITLTNATVNGALNSSGNISLTGGSVSSSVITTNGTVTTTSNTTIGGAVSASSNINLGGGSVAAAVTSSGGTVTTSNTTIGGAVSANGNINLTGGSVTGQVTSTANTITTNGTNLNGGARAQSGMSITGGTLAGDFVMTASTAMTLTGVVITSGSIAGASSVTIQGASVLGSSSATVNVNTTSNEINVNNSLVYGNLTAANNSTVNVTNGATVYGTCLPNSTPANACSAAPPSPMNCLAGISSGITGNYYNNTQLTEPSTASRSDAPIDFNWAAGAPGPAGINADVFSVRWQGYIRVTQSGSYRFQTVSDDGVRLSINGNMVINRWNDHAATTDTTGDIPLVAGQTYSITLEFYENGGDAVIRLQWRLPGASTYVAIPGGPLPTMGAGLYECTPVPYPPVSSCPTSLSAGITGNYFNNQTLTAPVTATRVDGPINFDWGTGAPGPAGVGDNNFSVRWSGYLRVTQSGVYRFQTNSDDGIRLTVNGTLLINQWNDHSVATHTSAAVNLTANVNYPITMEFYENAGYAVAQLLWQTPGSSSYVAIPRGSTPVSSAGLYDCISTPGSYLITHNAQGITCAAEPVTVAARNTAGVVYNPPNGTVVTLSTTPATGVWVGGDTYTFNGNESSFVKYLQQTTPGALRFDANSATATGTSNITFVDTVLRIALNSALANIPTQVAGVNGNAIAKVISTNPKTGVCEAKVASRTLPVGLAFTCNNPTTCVAGQSFTVNSFPITANNNAAPVTYNNINLVFNASAEAPMTINYSDVGQVTLHGRLTIPDSGVDPALTISASSNSFVVKPYTLAVTAVAQTASPFAVNPGTTNSGSGFIPAGEKFTVSVKAYNALFDPNNLNLGLTPNFGNEVLVSGLSVERNKIQLQMGCPERTNINDAACTTRKPGYPIGDASHPVVGESALIIGDDVNADSITDPYGALSAGAMISGVWDEVGSFRLEPGLSGTGYLGQGNVIKIAPSGNIGRFYPASFSLLSPLITNSCANNFSYMEHPNIKVEYTVNALNKKGSVVKNYDNKDLGYVVASIDHVVKDLSAIIDLNANKSYRFSMVNNFKWENGVLNVKSSTAAFNRARNPSGNIIAESPFKNNLELGAKISSVDPVNQVMNLNAEKKGTCSSDCNAHSLGIFNEIRFGRLRLDSGFGSGTAELPVNFITEYWTGSFWAKNIDDSCTQISRNNIFYKNPEVPISTDSNLDVVLTGGTTTGEYGFKDSTFIRFELGDAKHKFSAPGGSTNGSFPVRVNLASYPWLTYDWNQTNGTPTVDQCNPPASPDPDCSIRATFGFGSYRGHDRVIYWREKFQ